LLGFKYFNKLLSRSPESRYLRLLEQPLLFEKPLILPDNAGVHSEIVQIDGDIELHRETIPVLPTQPVYLIHDELPYLSLADTMLCSDFRRCKRQFSVFRCVKRVIKTEGPSIECAQDSVQSRVVETGMVRRNYEGDQALTPSRFHIRDMKKVEHAVPARIHFCSLKFDIKTLTSQSHKAVLLYW